MFVWLTGDIRAAKYGWPVNANVLLRNDAGRGHWKRRSLTDIDLCENGEVQMLSFVLSETGTCCAVQLAV